MINSPLWFRIIQYIIVLGFPVLTIFLFYWGIKISLIAHMANAIPMLFFACVSIFATYVTFPLLKYIDAIITYGPNGFTVKLRDEETKYLWSDIERTRNHGVLGVLSFLHKNGKCVYVVYKLTPGYVKFTRRVREHVGIRS